MQVFEYVVFYDPSQLAIKAGAKPAILKASEKILANSPQEASIKAYREIPDEYVTDDKISDVKVTVRPF